MIFFSNQTIYIYKQVKAGCEFRAVEAGELLDADSNSAHSLIKAFTLYCECMAYQVGLRAWLGNLGHCCSKCASFFLKTRVWTKNKITKMPRNCFIYYGRDHLISCNYHVNSI